MTTQNSIKSESTENTFGLPSEAEREKIWQLNSRSSLIVAPLNLTDAQEAILLNLRISRPGIKRKVTSDKVSVDCDKDAIAVSKELLSCPEYEAIEHFDRAIRTWTGKKCLPAHKCLKEGIYRVPPGLTDEIHTDLKRLYRERDQLIDAMLNVYTDAIYRAKDRLRSLFNPFDYLDEKEFSDAFKFEWSFFTLSVPSSLPDFIRLQEARKFAAFQEASLRECRDALRESFCELVNRAVERLGSDPNGKPLRFKSDMLERMDEFLTYFAKRNIADDTSVATLVERAKAVLRGVPSADSLREDADLRTTVRTAFAAIQDDLISQGIETAERRIEL